MKEEYERFFKECSSDVIKIKPIGGETEYSMTVSHFMNLMTAKLIDDGFIEANPKRWVRPTLAEIDLYFCAKLGAIGLGGSNKLHDERERKAHDQAERFFNYWDGLDWKSGKTRIKSWKGRANTWIKNNEKYKRNDARKAQGSSTADKVAASIADRNR